MKIAVIGAGIIGITTSYELALDGHEVEVFERRNAAAEETSFANAGILAPGYVTPWAAPGMPGKMLAQMFRRHAGIRLALPLALSDFGWMWRWYRACRLDVYQANRAHLQRLAFYSRERLRDITTRLKLEFDRSDGYLVLLRSDRDRAMAEPSLQVLRNAGVSFQQLDTIQARRAEPALNPDTPFAGAILCPDDGVGNCRQFALMLKNEAQRLGVLYRFGTTVQGLDSQRGVSVVCAPDGEARHFDAVVVCAGTESTRLLRPLGIRVPMAAVHGYSISAAIREPLNAPRSGVMDEHYKVAISRLGQRVRVAGGAELGGLAARHNQASIRTLYKVLHDWFPGAASATMGVQEWKGARPMLPNRPPMVGDTPISGLWLNLGHGSSGWAMACGSARLLADQMQGRKPEIDVAGFAVAAPES